MLLLSQMFTCPLCYICYMQFKGMIWHLYKVLWKLFIWFKSCMWESNTWQTHGHDVSRSIICLWNKERELKTNSHSMQHNPGNNYYENKHYYLRFTCSYTYPDISSIEFARWILIKFGIGVYTESCQAKLILIWINPT